MLLSFIVHCYCPGRRQGTTALADSKIPCTDVKIIIKLRHVPVYTELLIVRGNLLPVDVKMFVENVPTCPHRAGCPVKNLMYPKVFKPRRNKTWGISSILDAIVTKRTFTKRILQRKSSRTSICSLFTFALSLFYFPNIKKILHRTSFFNASLLCFFSWNFFISFSTLKSTIFAYYLPLVFQWLYYQILLFFSAIFLFTSLFLFLFLLQIVLSSLIFCILLILLNFFAFTPCIFFLLLQYFFVSISIDYPLHFKSFPGLISPGNGNTLKFSLFWHTHNVWFFNFHFSVF